MLYDILTWSKIPGSVSKSPIFFDLWYAVLAGWSCILVENKITFLQVINQCYKAVINKNTIKKARVGAPRSCQGRGGDNDPKLVIKRNLKGWSLMKILWMSRGMGICERCSDLDNTLWSQTVTSGGSCRGEYSIREDLGNKTPQYIHTYKQVLRGMLVGGHISPFPWTFIEFSLNFNPSGFV